jgi:hypothetical protein
VEQMISPANHGLDQSQSLESLQTGDRGGKTNSRRWRSERPSFQPLINNKSIDYKKILI